MAKTKPGALARVAVFGTGRMGKEMIRACVAAPALDLTAGIVVDPAKHGRDLGELAGIGALGLPVSSDLDAVLTRSDIDLIFYCGRAPEVAKFLGRFVDAGKDAITLTGLVHPPTALGPKAAQDLATRTLRGNARVVGAGWNPGFVMDVLPVVYGSACVNVGHIYARRVAEAQDWSTSVQDACGIGRSPIEATGSLGNPLEASLAMIGEGLGLDVERIESAHEPYVSTTRREHAGRIVEPGQNAGFHLTSTGYAGGRAVATLEMFAIFGIDPAVDQVVEGAQIKIDGDTTIETEMRGNWFGDSYPATAARGVNAVGPLRKLPPGLYRPDQLAVSTR